MKSLFIKSLTFSMFILLFTSCKKDETQTVAQPGTAPILTGTQSGLVLVEEDAAKTAGSFTWTTSSFGYEKNIVSYALQIDVAGNNFAAPKEVAVESALTKSLTVAEINSLVNQLKLKIGVAGKVEVRVKASVSDYFTPAYSNVLTLTVTPYKIIIVYPSLWVPGSYQGWAPATAPTVGSVDDNGIYEGYINFPDASAEFKFTAAPDWDHLGYGTSSAGTLNAGGGDNLKMTGTGYYLVKADTKALTYSLTKTSWSVMGTALSAETAMTYSTTTKVWSATAVLSAGSFKFRANGSDTINFGDTTDKDGNLAYGGTGIAITAAGTYLITMDLSNPGNYSYTLTKQ